MTYISKCNFTNWIEVSNMPLFYDEKLMICTKHFFKCILYNGGIRYDKNMLNEDGSFKKWNDMKNYVNNGINFLEFYRIFNAIKVLFAENNINNKNESLRGFQNPNINCYLYQMITKSCNTKFTYNTLIKNNEKLSCHSKWKNTFPKSNNWNVKHSIVFNLYFV